MTQPGENNTTHPDASATSLDTQLKVASAAVEFAEDMRVIHRHRTEPGSRQRETDLDAAAKRLSDAMLPLRRHQARVAYRNRPLSDAQYARIREASSALQSERRKLWKMRRRRDV